MSFSINHRKSGTVTVVDLGGRIILGEPEKQLLEHINELIRQGDRSFLLNLGNVNFLDSAGLGTIVKCYKAATENNGHLKLLNVPPKVLRLLQITNLQTFFEIFDDETTALNSYAIPQ